MIHEITPHKYSNEYHNREVCGQDVLLIVQENRVWMKTVENQIQLPTYQEIYETYQAPLVCQFLFVIDETAYYLCDIAAENTELLQQLGYQPFAHGTYRAFEPMWKVFACATGEQLARWYQGNHFCGKCGSTMEHRKTERSLICSKCGKVLYPTISPCVIVAITDGNRILLTRYAHASYRNYALVAGFAEIGESIEETVHREVFEETGLKVKNLRYYKSQPWGFTDTLLFGFFVDLDGSDHVTLQEEELAEAKWFEREELFDGTSTLSLTNEMIQQFRYHMEWNTEDDLGKYN